MDLENVSVFLFDALHVHNTYPFLFLIVCLVQLIEAIFKRQETSYQMEQILTAQTFLVEHH
jgi:hypothetical protein